MANTLGVCLIALALFSCTNYSFARELPQECHKGPSYWCQSLKRAADCGAVEHCISSVWENQNTVVTPNEYSEYFVRLFRQLKDVKDLINADYLATRMSSACQDVGLHGVRKICKENTALLDQQLSHLLRSEASAETICSAVGLCNNPKLDFLISSNMKNSAATEKGTTKDTSHKPGSPALLGSKKCTWGPSYWCSNFSTGRECKATHHCVTKVWSKLQFPEDNDGVCKICLDMVKQARDQLESNETQSELKQVFEGSCKLIPIKVVTKECIKMADDFVPELVESLASQMNPQAVCSVAGLCNNARIDALLEKYNVRKALREDCNNCQKTVGVLRKRFDNTTEEDFLVQMLKICRRFGHLSDSCSMLVFKYYENIVAALKQDLTPESVCHVSGQCAFYYHEHDEFVFPPVIMEDLKASDDVPCEFCEQLVVHLRDTLVANTTELQFEKVLRGLCKQTGKFQDECLHLVEQYYPEMYQYLVADLKPAELCAMIGICKDRVINAADDIPVAPLLPEELSVKVTPSSKLIGDEEDRIGRVPLTKQANVRIMGNEPVPPPLPLERMLVGAPPELQSNAPCTFCQYFLHYLQVELSDTKNEEMVKDAVEKACDRLPDAVNSQCREFVTEYGPSVIALLIQEIDPSSVCPSLRLCPQTQEVKRVDINSEKGNCPLCLFAVEQLETMLKNSNRSKEAIRHALDNLCNHLSTKLRTQCVDFVDLYSTQLIEMLLANLNAQEICVYLTLCKDDTSTDPLRVSGIYRAHEMPPEFASRSHEIPQDEELTDPMRLSRFDRDHEMPTDYASRAHEIPDDDDLSDPMRPSSIDEYHRMPHHMADRNNMRRPMLPKHMLVDQGGDIETNEIPDNTVNGQVVMAHGRESGQKTVCIMCEFVLKQIDDEIKDKHNEDEIKKVVHNVCRRMPKSVKTECDQFVEKYADLVISLLAQELDPDEVCRELKLCDGYAHGSKQFNKVKDEILDCAVCETVVAAVKKVITADVVDRNIVHIVEKSCGVLPAKYSARCHTMMEIYGDSVIHLIEQYGSKQVCSKIGLCAASQHRYLRMHRARP